MKKRRVLAAIMTATLALSLAGCGGSSGDSKSSGSSDGSVANADKPLCWFNRQPSNSSTGELDKEALPAPSPNRMQLPRSVQSTSLDKTSLPMTSAFSASPVRR